MCLRKRDVFSICELVPRVEIHLSDTWIFSILNCFFQKNNVKYTHVSSVLYKLSRFLSYENLLIFSFKPL